MQAARISRHRITWTRVTATQQNSFGEDIGATITVGTFASGVVPLTGRELESAHQTWAEAKYKVSMRYQPSVEIRRGDRGTWGTRILDVLDVQEVNHMNRELVLICKEYVA